MKYAVPVFVLSGVLSIAPAMLHAQDTDPVTTRQLTDHLYLLSTDQGAYTTNTIASVGEDGLLLVDTQADTDAEALKAAVDALAYGTPKYIINTHRHVEHVGGNAIFGDEPVVIAHYLLPEKLTSGSFIFEEYPAATFPDTTVTDSLILNFNGEPIRIIEMAGSHDDNEIIVHFTKSKVVHLSSLTNGFNFPSVDSDGDALRFAELVARAMKILPEDVMIVSGHNDVGKWSDLKPYHDMLVASERIVREGLAAGKSVEQMQTEKVLEKYEHYAGSYVSSDRWMEYLADAIQKTDEPRKKNIYEPIYHAMKEGGVEAGIDHFRALKADTSGAYEINEIELLIIGDKLLDKKRLPEAVRYLTVYLEEYPEAEYAYYAHYDLAQALKQQGDTKSAIDHCERCLALKADFQRAADLLAELKGP